MGWVGRARHLKIESGDEQPRVDAATGADDQRRGRHPPAQLCEDEGQTEDTNPKEGREGDESGLPPRRAIPV